MARINCRAKSIAKCRVHGDGGMFEQLIKEEREHINAGRISSYIATRSKLDALTDSNQEALDFYKNKNGDSTKDKTPLSERIGDKVYDAFDRMEEVKENIGETISEGVDRITDRHESPIPAEIGGGTMAWSDLNPFKNPFKNGKLR